MVVFGMAVVLSIWWAGTKIEQRYWPHRQAQPQSPGLWKELKEFLGALVSLPVVIAVAVLSGWGNPRHKQEPSFHGLGDTEKRMAWVSPVVFQERLRQRDATLRYWNTTVAALHVVRFSTPSGQEPAEKYYERMFQQLRIQTSAAKSASTTDVAPELLQMVAKHLAIDDQLLELQQKQKDLIRGQENSSATDTVDQRLAMAQLLLGVFQTNPDALKNVPPGSVRSLVEQALVLEELQQERFREIEIMRAVLQERYIGTEFPLPAISL